MDSALRICFVHNLNLDAPFGATLRGIALLRALNELGTVDIVKVSGDEGEDISEPSRWSEGIHYVLHSPQAFLPVAREPQKGLWSRHRLTSFVQTLLQPQPSPALPWSSQLPVPESYDLVWTNDWPANRVGASIPARARVWDMVDYALYGDTDAAGPGIALSDVPALGLRRVLGNRLRRMSHRQEYTSHAALVDHCALSHAGEARRSGISPLTEIPNAYPFAPEPSSIEPTHHRLPHVLFVGGFTYPPNREGMDWFLAEVWPLVEHRVPRAELHIVGDAGHATYGTGAGAVHVHDRVGDLTPLLATASISVAPLLAGTGSRLKILESWAHGVPVVSTSIGASGLNAHPGENILIADTAHDFADAIAQLLDDPRLATRIAAKGLETFVRDHSQQRIDADVARVVQQVLGGTSGHAQ